MSDHQPRPRHRALIAASLSLSLLAVPQVQAFERVATGARHFFQCFGLMLSKPATHEQECLPNRVPSPNGSIASSGGGPVVAPPVIVTPPPPPPEPEPEIPDDNPGSGPADPSGPQDEVG